MTTNGTPRAERTIYPTARDKEFVDWTGKLHVPHESVMGADKKREGWTACFTSIQANDPTPKVVYYVRQEA